MLPATDKRHIKPDAKARAKPYSFSGMQKIVQRLGKDIGLPPELTLDACRHGGMTELEEAELTEGGSGRRAVRTPHPGELRGVCQAHRAASFGRDQEAPGARLGERTGNIHSEYAGDCRSEWKSRKRITC